MGEGEPDKKPFNEEREQRLLDLQCDLFEADQVAQETRLRRIEEILYESPLPQLGGDIVELQKRAGDNYPNDKTGREKATWAATAAVAAAAFERRLKEELIDTKK